MVCRTLSCPHQHFLGVLFVVMMCLFKTTLASAVVSRAVDPVAGQVLKPISCSRVVVLPGSLWILGPGHSTRASGGYECSVAMICLRLL